MSEHASTEAGAEAAAGQAADAAHGAAAAEHAQGLPQLDFSTFPNQILWLVLALVAIYYILTRVALPRIAGVLSERQGTISNDIAQAEDLKRRAEAAEAEYEQALADARAEAQRIIGEAKAEMQVELDAEIARADAAIAEKLAESEATLAEIREGALEAIRAVAEETTGELVSVLGGTAEAEAIRSAITARLEG